MDDPDFDTIGPSASNGGKPPAKPRVPRKVPAKAKGKRPGPGHNSKVAAPAPPSRAHVLGDYVKKLARLATLRRVNTEQQHDVFRDAKAEGFHPKALKRLVKQKLETDEQRAKRLAVEDAFEQMEFLLEAEPVETQPDDGSEVV